VLSTDLLKWFEQNKRDLPWRKVSKSKSYFRDPYRVWVSEIMLQQTQVKTVIPYFKRWLKAFPNLKAFASADLDDVLKQWEGLGYYRRARNLHKGAQVVMNDYAGKIPITSTELALRTSLTKRKGRCFQRSTDGVRGNGMHTKKC